MVWNHFVSSICCLKLHACKGVVYGFKGFELTKLFSNLFAKPIQVSISRFCIQLWEIFMCTCIMRSAQEQWKISQSTAIMATMITLSFTESSRASWSKSFKWWHWKVVYLGWWIWGWISQKVICWFPYLPIVTPIICLLMSITHPKCA